MTVDSDSWCTPQWLCHLLGRFDLDPCSNDRSHVFARTRYAIETGNDGLVEPWRGSVFLNPPYSKPLPWCKRLADHAGAPWVALVKLDPTTRWWYALMEKCSMWAPFRERIAFERPDKPDFVANFPSALVWRLWEPSDSLVDRLWLPRYARAA